MACAILGPANPKQFFFSWLVAFLFFLSLALGALFFVLIQYAAQGGWGIVLRRIGENDVRDPSVMAVLFVPVLLGLHDLYEWSHAGAAEHDALLRWKAPYLNEPFFLVRAALYFAVWSVIAVCVLPRLARPGRDRGSAVSARLRRFAGPALIVARADPDLRRDRLDHVAHAALVLDDVRRLLLRRLLRRVHRAALGRGGGDARGLGCWTRSISPEHLHDLGKFLFAFTVFWAYIAFSQFFLMWYANMPEETIFYKARLEGSWKTVSILLTVGHFAVPFLFLMGRAVKRNGDRRWRSGARGCWPCTSSISTGR